MKWKAHRQVTIHETEKHSNFEAKSSVDEHLDRRLSELVCGTILLDCIINIRYIIGDASPLFNPDTVFLLSTICLVALLIRTIPSIIKRINWKTICVFLFVLAITLLSFVLFPENNHQFINTCRYFYAACLPTILVLPLISNYDVLKNKLFTISRVICVIGAIIVFFTWTKYTGKTETYNMELGYSLLLPLLITMYRVSEKKSAIDIILIATTLVFIIMGGSRGPIIPIIIFAIFLLIKKAITSKRILKTIIIICVLVTAFLNISNITNTIGDIAQNLHINSRTVRLLGEGLSHDSGRSAIYDITKNEIQNAPLEIRGINADYNLLGIYTHNIMLELLYQFGLIIGVMMIAGLLYLVIMTVIGSLKDTSIANLSMVFMMSSIPCLMLSNSLWVKYEFWLWIVTSITMVAIKVGRRKEKEEVMVKEHSQVTNYSVKNIGSLQE